MNIWYLFRRVIFNLNTVRHDIITVYMALEFHYKQFCGKTTRNYRIVRKNKKRYSSSSYFKKKKTKKTKKEPYPLELAL